MSYEHELHELLEDTSERAALDPLEHESAELPYAPPELEQRAIRLRPIVESARVGPLVASGSAKLRLLASHANDHVRMRTASARTAVADRSERAGGGSDQTTEIRELARRSARRASRELTLARYELRETWNDVARAGRAWHRRRHGVRRGQEDIERYRALGDRRREALELNALARLYRERGEYQEAVVCYSQALTIFERLGNRRGACLSLSNLGLALDAQGNRSKAVRCYEEALDLARMLNDRHIEGQVLANLGTSYARQGRPSEGRDLWLQALGLMTPGTTAHRQLSRHLGLGT